MALTLGGVGLWLTPHANAQNGTEPNKSVGDEQPASGAETETTPPSVIPLTNAEAVATEIKRVTDDVTLDENMRERMLSALKEIDAMLANQRQAANELAAYKKSLSRIAIDKEIASRNANREISQPPEINGRALSIEELKQYEIKAGANLAAAREDLQQADLAITNRKRRLEKLPGEIAARRRELEVLEASSIGELSDDPGGTFRRVRETLRESQIASTRQTLDALQAEQLLLESQVDLLPLRKAAEAKNVIEAELAYNQWSAFIQKLRQNQVTKELKEYQSEIEKSGGDVNASQALKLKDEWVEIIGETDQADRMLAKEEVETKKWAENLAKTELDIAEANISGEQLSSGVGLQLQLMKNRLPSVQAISRQIATIDENIEQRRELQRQVELTLEGIDDSIAGELPMEVFSEQVIMGNHRSRSGLPENEVRLLSKFIADLETHLTKLVERRKELERQLKIVNKLGSEIDSHIIWIRNDAVFRLRDIPLAWRAFRWIIHPQHLGLLAMRLATGFWQRPELILIAVAAFAVILVGGARLRRRIVTLGQRASSRQYSSLRPTFATTLLSFALVLPLALLLWIVGDALIGSRGDEPLVRAVAKAFHLAAMAIFPIELLRQWLRPSGLAVAHLGTDEDSIRGLRRWLRVLIDLGVPILIVYATSVNLGRYQLTLALGRVLLIAGMILLSVVLWRTLEPKRGIFSVAIRDNPNGWLARLQHVWFLPIVWLPIVFAGIAVAGYGSAAAVLIRQFYFTFWLLLAAYFVDGVMRRWLLTQRRSLAWAVHRERLEESERIGGVAGLEGVEVEPTLGLEAAEINAQTSRLISTFLFIALLFGIAYVWSPVLPAIGYLEAIRISEIADEKGEISYVTLADLLKAIPVLVLTWASVRNLPGLIEAVLLERLPLEKPVRYAITTLGTYALLFVGLTFSAHTFGLRWDNIQWLVAALGVGLGFGLQEIFANFVSGLILLFEQPIRVGDIVTLGDTTGVVARIRMRATTVTNWDRQELIIPNKDLITGRLINWTLSDTTNRVVINVGVAYGSDTDKACELLREICQQHPAVKKDPAPLVTFEGFGDSTLNLVLRCYLSDLDNRLATIHDLHTEINKQYYRAGIEIAFPQRDLHLRSLPKELIDSLVAGKPSS
ncbi:mechanosensitive ion channel domain-containing protein [Neorhodopirellula pilleata]|uniref:Mechanosensitive channel MscK n=1 Tax=Neorhodopirellula pilleata TaxID=2714738 RepID=A0A5C6AY52_9BACT|nr:mechanosensitive ion channel domain-containing protein [Neorhodopirellula pilleata]TWU04022.1 Mechanosensitive channel MscK precursor [Neorhodopirellula pilleata]